MRTSLIAAAAAAFFIFSSWSAPATAQPNASFSIPVAATILGGATLVIGAIALPASNTTTFAFDFVLPRDYVNDTEVLVVLNLSADDSPCTLRLVADTMGRRRAPRPVILGLAGLTAPNPNVDFPSANVLLRQFSINPGGAMPGQRRGDAITLQLRREGNNAADDCGSVFVGTIDVRYTAQ